MLFALPVLVLLLRTHTLIYHHRDRLTEPCQDIKDIFILRATQLINTVVTYADIACILCFYQHHHPFFRTSVTVRTSCSFTPHRKKSHSAVIQLIFLCFLLQSKICFCSFAEFMSPKIVCKHLHAHCLEEMFSQVTIFTLPVVGKGTPF